MPQMASFYVSLNGNAVTHARIHVPRIGAWWADIELADDGLDPSGPAILQVGSVQLKGTIVLSHSGEFALQHKLRVVAGANGWASSIDRQAFHNDAGVRAKEVIAAAALAAGETIGTFPTNALPGVDYIQESGLASRVIEDAARGIPWRVDFNGVTQVAEWPEGPADPAHYQILNFNPKIQEAELVVDEINSVSIGQTIQSPQGGGDLKVSSLDIEISPAGIRMLAWTGGDQQSQLVDSLRAIVARSIDSKLFGKYRFRVVSMSGDRVNVQPVRSVDGLPDALSISMGPGVAGAHAVLALGAHVYVEFEGGDRSFPIISGFAGKDGQGWVPQELQLGGNDTSIARVGDLVQAGGPGLVVNLWPVTGIPAPPNAAVVAGVPHYLSFSPIPIDPLQLGTDLQPLYGAILNGSPLLKTKAGT